MASNNVEVFIKLQSGKAVSSEFRPSDTVGRIISFVAHGEEGVPEKRVRLKYQGKTLDPRHTVGYLGIRPETILRGEILEPKEFEICITFQDGRSEKISVVNIDTVADLKNKIETVDGPATRDQKLEVKGGGNITKENHRMLCDVGVVNETVIQVTEVDDNGYGDGGDTELDDSKKQELMSSFDAAGRSVEVAFCFDTTGSMYSCLKTVRRKLRQTCTRLLRDIPNMRIAIMAHGDYCDYTNYVERHVDLTSDVDSLVSFAKNVPSTGGGDAPECYEWALRKCQQLDWSEDSAKAFVMIGDCLPHQPAYTDQNIFWGTELDVLIGMGVKVYGVQAYDHEESTPFYKELAERSGGFYLQLNHFDLITDMFLAVCYKEAHPDQLDAFIDEVEQEGRLTGDTKDLLEKLDEAPKEKEERESTDAEKPNWWDEWLNEDIPLAYIYVPENDSWRPVGYENDDNDDDDDDDDHDDSGHRGGYSGRHMRGRGGTRGRGRGGRRRRGRRSGARTSDEERPGTDERAMEPPTEDWVAPPLEDWSAPPAGDWSSPPLEDWSAPRAEDWGALPAEDWGAPAVDDWGHDADDTRGDSSARGRGGRRSGRRGGRREMRGRERGRYGRGRGRSDAEAEGDGNLEGAGSDIGETPKEDPAVEANTADHETLPPDEHGV